MTTKQKEDIECVKWFIPACCKDIKITDDDELMFLEWSERGKHKEKIKDNYFTDGFNALREGKRWRGIHIHEMWEKGILDGSVPYFTLLGGEGEEIMPRVVVDYMKKEMFKGRDSDVIEKCYLSIIK